MAVHGRTWWGERFLAALETFTDSGRLARGRSYANPGRILEHGFEKGTMRARVRGNINPYFGVYEEPIYRTSIALGRIDAKDWARLIEHIGARADLVTRLLMHEMPENIESAFDDLGRHLLPHDQRDITTKCSCPDWANPCKHVAGLYYVMARELDGDPFLLFEWRGLARDDLRAALARTTLGRVLADALAPRETPIEPAASYYTVPVRGPAPAALDVRQFWQGAKRLPPPPGAPAAGPRVPALLIKRQGDYPAFWPKSASFIGVMETVYERVRSKSAQMK